MVNYNKNQLVLVIENKISDIESYKKSPVLIDIPYPRKFYDKIRKGEHVDFQELIKTGMVFANFTYDFNKALEIQNGIRLWASNQPHSIIFDLDEEQKWLDRLTEIHRNNQKLDLEGLNELFGKICLYSTVFSEHKDIDKPILISSDILTVTFGNGVEGYYVVISSHPDLIKGNRIEQYADDSFYRLKQVIGKKFTNKKISPIPRLGWTENQKEAVRIHQDGKCNLCKKPPPRWEYHHKDGNRNNNDISNCEGLCPNCHSVQTYDKN